LCPDITDRVGGDTIEKDKISANDDAADARKTVYWFYKIYSFDRHETLLR